MRLNGHFYFLTNYLNFNKLIASLLYIPIIGFSKYTFFLRYAKITLLLYYISFYQFDLKLFW
jgi:hypothetical protein